MTNYSKNNNNNNKKTNKYKNSKETKKTKSENVFFPNIFIQGKTNRGKYWIVNFSSILGYIILKKFVNTEDS